MKILLLLLTSLALLAQKTLDPARLEGRTVNSISGEPVRRAALTLQPVGAGAPLNAVSTADGAFVFEKIPAGRYKLHAERAGFVDQEFGARSAFASGATLDLGPGSSLKDLAFKLAPHAVIGGKVVDANNDPVAIVTVSAFRKIGNGRSAKLVKVHAVDTNDLGEYRLAGLPPGNYVLAGDPPATQPNADTPNARNVTTYHPSTASFTSAVEVPVTPGQESFGRDIQLQNAPVYSVRGKLAALRQNIHLTLFPKNEAEIHLGFDRPSAIPAADGSFKLEGVPAGSYQLVGIESGSQGRVVGVMPLDIAGVDLRNVSFPISEPANLQAVIRVDGDRSRLTAPVTLTLQPEGVPMLAPYGQMSRDGQIRVEGVSRLLYRMNLHGLPEEAYVKSASVAGRDILQDGLDLRTGASGPLEITLGMKAGIATGAVQEAAKAAPGAVVVLLPEATRRDPMLYRKVTAGESGEFQIASLPPGRYQLWALPEGAEVDPYADADWLRSSGDPCASVTLNESERRSADLKLLPVDGSPR